MGRPPDFFLPRPPRWPPWAIAASVALHLAILVALATSFIPPSEHSRGSQLVVLAPTAPPWFRTVAMPSGATGGSPATTPPEPVIEPASHAIASPAAAAPEAQPEDLPLPWAPAQSSPDRLRPSMVTGVLWDRRPVAPARVARSHAERTDSAVKAIISHYLDSLAALPGGGQLLPPSWKATIAGQEFGLDGQFITLAGVKIPSLVLALIPMPNGGNESKALDVGARMRAEDYELALPRQAAAADQREQAREIRERNAAEQEVNRKQREGSVP